MAEQVSERVLADGYADARADGPEGPRGHLARPAVHRQAAHQREAAAFDNGVAHPVEPCIEAGAGAGRHG